MNKLAAIITGVKNNEEKNIDGCETERRVALVWFHQSGKTQVELSKFCGVSQGTISNIKDGIKGSKATFRKIAKAFNKEYEDYFKEGNLSPVPTDQPNSQIENDPKVLMGMVLQKIEDSKKMLMGRIEQLEKQVAGLVAAQQKQARAATDRRQVQGVSPTGIERRLGNGKIDYDGHNVE